MKDAKKTMEAFDKVIRLSNLYLIHVNDSRNELGSRKDRHEHIGKGFIGPAAFAEIMNDKGLEDIPKILETPKGDGETDYDAINLQALRDFTSPGSHKR
jgi:deoxyribonuclease-4